MCTPPPLPQTFVYTPPHFKFLEITLPTIKDDFESNYEVSVSERVKPHTRQ